MIEEAPQGRHHARGFYSAPVFSAAAAAARWLPLALTRAVLAAGGAIYAWTHPAAVRVVERNLALLGPVTGGHTRDARRVYAEFGRTIADYFFIGSRPRPEAVKIISEIVGHEHLETARQAGRGALIITAHLGLFELGGLLMARSGVRSVALTYAEPSSGLTTWRAAFRQRWGVETIEIGGDSFAFLHIAARLREGCFVATLIDRPHPREAVTVQFPGGAAGFSPGILLLAAHTGTPVIPATMVRAADGLYRARVFPPLQIEMRGTRAETLAFYSQRLADILHPALCAHAEQWYQFVPLWPSPSPPPA